MTNNTELINSLKHGMTVCDNSLKLIQAISNRNAKTIEDHNILTREYDKNIGEYDEDFRISWGHCDGWVNLTPDAGCHTLCDDDCKNKKCRNIDGKRYNRYFVLGDTSSCRRGFGTQIHCKVGNKQTVRQKCMEDKFYDDWPGGRPIKPSPMLLEDLPVFNCVICANSVDLFAEGDIIIDEGGINQIMDCKSNTEKYIKQLEDEDMETERLYKDEISNEENRRMSLLSTREKLKHQRYINEIRAKRFIINMDNDFENEYTYDINSKLKDNFIFISGTSVLLLILTLL